MKVSTPTLAPHAWSERRQAALLTLLGDEDPAVFSAVREHLVTHGAAALGWLRSHLACTDPMVRKRVRAIVTDIERHLADDQFLQFCLRSPDHLDLERGALLLARTRDPEVNLEGYHALLESYAASLRERIKPRSHARTRIHLVNSFFYNDLGILSTDEFALRPDSTYLNTVLHKGVASPIAAGILYLILGRRLDLPLSGVYLPGLFLCRYQTSTAEIFIEASGAGALLSRATALRRARSRMPDATEADLKPATSRQLLAAMCAQLYAAHSSSGETVEAARLRRYQLALERERA
ncbi:MAG: transglutaminase-like domain-containing protein [Verrucomicrobiota bacterium]|nr:transglutaminase-like domain-containing protein [Limisphaera sp.]MDW8381835.1 transglutaminase-like domain-containing protein [Verrucomicrobiota bacterium]